MMPQNGFKIFGFFATLTGQLLFSFLWRVVVIWRSDSHFHSDTFPLQNLQIDICWQDTWNIRQVRTPDKIKTINRGKANISRITCTPIESFYCLLYLIFPHDWLCPLSFFIDICSWHISSVIRNAVSLCQYYEKMYNLTLRVWAKNTLEHLCLLKTFLFSFLRL